ncbi:MAG: MFS transporter [Desulfobacterales bacterium]|nr:MFS transporter [Desulfobacterales bacterium]
MMNELSKGKILLFLGALYLSSLALMGDMVLIPAFNSLFDTFYDSIHWVNFIISGPALVSVLASLLTGKVLQYVSKKNWLVIGFAIFTVGSIFGVAVEDVRYMSMMRVLVGFGMGIVAPTSMALIAEIFTDEAQRGKAFGTYNAAIGVVGAAVGLVAGYLAAESWQSVFKVYWVSIPILFMIAAFVPNTAPADELHNSHETNDQEKTDQGLPIIPVAALNGALFVFSVVYMVVYYQIAVYVVKNGLGDESVAGIFSALGTVGSTVVSVMFGAIYSKLKRATIIPSYGLMVICFILLWKCPNLIVAGIACTLMGVAFGNGYAYFMMRSTMIVPPSQASNSSGIFYAVFSIGMFCSPFMVTWLQKTAGVDTLIGIMPVLTGIMTISTILSIILTLMEKKRPLEYQQNNQNNNESIPN